MTISSLGGSGWVKKSENDRKLLISMSLILKQSVLMVSHCHCVSLCEEKGIFSAVSSGVSLADEIIVTDLLF